GRRPLVAVHVDLADLRLAGKRRRHLVDMRSDHAARAAPTRPKINEDGNIRLQYIAVERVVRKLKCVRSCHLFHSSEEKILFLNYRLDARARPNDSRFLAARTVETRYQGSKQPLPGSTGENGGAR